MANEHFRYDSEAVVPDNLPELPVGTLAELEAEGLDPRTVPCCHKRVVNADGVVVKGCPKWDRCRLAIRAQAGPQFFGVKVTKGKIHGGSVVRAVRDCFYIAEQKEAIEENGGVLEIVATEGQEFEYVTTIPNTVGLDNMEFVKPPVPSKQPQRVRIRVPKFQRPGENPDLAQELLKAITREEEKGRADEQRIAKVNPKPVKG